jgi:tetratricopeptide (TPR) repeat protein
MKYFQSIVVVFAVMFIATIFSHSIVHADEETAYERALGLTRERRFSEAIPLLEEWCNKYPRDPRGAYLLAQSYMTTRQNEKALERLNIILGHHPDDDRNNFLMGVLLLPSAPDRAEIYLQKAVNAQPDNAQYNHRLGGALMAQRKYSDAEKPLRDTVKFAPNDLRARLDLGRVLLANSKAADAVTHLEAATRGSDKEAAFYLLGTARLQTSDFDGAVSALNEAVKLTPDDARVHYNLGIALEGQLGDQAVGLATFKPVIDAYSKAVNLNTDVPEYHFRLANAYESAVRSIYAQTPENETLASEALDYLAKAKNAYNAVDSDSARQRISTVEQMIENIKNPEVIIEEFTE